MTKKSKMIKLIMLILVLIAVIAAYFVVEKMNKEKQEKDLIESTSEESVAISIPSVDTDKVVSFSYRFDGVEYQFKKENDTWYCTNDESKELDQDKLNELVSNFKNVTVSRVVEEAAIDLSQYGLDNPTNTIEVVDTDGNTTAYQIGNKNDVADGYYIKMQDSNEVYLISSFPDEFSKTLDDLIKTEDTATDDTATDETTTDASATDSNSTTDTTTSTDTTTQE